MNFNKFAAELGIEIETFIELVDTWIQSTGEDITALYAAKESADANKTVEHSHKIKGSSSQLGFIEIAETAKDIENKARDGNIEGLAESLEILKTKRDEIIIIKNEISR
jgi:HPt (histidine-containing phosphotransfer) domain-containing protein